MKDSQEMIRSATEARGVARRVENDVPLPSVISYVEPEDDEGLPFREYWRAVYKRRWLIIGITLLVTLLTAVHMSRQPDVYESRARVQIDMESSKMIGTSNAAVTVVDPTYLSTQLQILTSTRLLRRVVKTLDLEHNKAFLSPRVPSTWQNLLRMFGFGGGDGGQIPVEEVHLASSITIAPDTSGDDLVEAERLESYVGRLRGGISVDPVKEARLPTRDTRLVDIRFTHRDPNVATKIVNTLAVAFVNSNIERRREASITSREFLNKRIAELQAEVRAGEQQMISFLQDNKITSLEPGQNEVAERLTALSRQLVEAEHARKQAESDYSLASNAAEEWVNTLMSGHICQTTFHVEFRAP
ncbi:MAG: Wzz/FepE/Etk N-terminal domain-containing protein [Acidobacteriota bacterium]|nr:Wzz/FepE/Etk N-terminal domain-containing protein [Acidobacteriota bacterium]